MTWDIKGKDNHTKATVHALEYNGEWMGQCYVSISVESPEPISFAIGDYIIYRGERFEINYDPGKIKSAPQFTKGDAFKYENVKFNSLSDELTRCDFLDVVLGDNQLHFTGLPKFSFYGGVQDLANRIQANLDRAYPNQWTVVVSPEYSGTKELNVSVDTQKVWDALSILVNDFETYFTIKGRTITIGAAGVPAGHLFKYGKGNGLYEIEQNAEADQAIVTRLRAYGSTRNLPHRYYNSLTGADGQKLIPDNMAVQNLMLPSFPYTTQDPYIDSANKAALGIREGTVFFDGSQEGLEEIYPSIEGMTAQQLHDAGVPCNSTGALDEIVSATQMTDNGVGKIEGDKSEADPATFKVTLKDLGFNLWEHRIAGTAPVISFKTGKLGGRDFEIVDCKKEGNNYVLELNRVYDDGIKLWFPYKDYNAATGDKFVLLHIEMPEVYIKAAAQRLLAAATEWLSKNDYSRSIYAPKIDEIFMARQHDEAMASGGTIKSLHDTIKEGMLLLFEDEDLNIDASIFIDRLTIKEGDGPIPTYEVVLKEEKTVGRLDKMQNQIDSLAAGRGQGGGGYNAAQIRSMIDAYGGSRFLSKIKDDRSAGQIATDKAFEVGKFLAGVSGAKIGIDAETGQTFGEMDKLFIRIKAYFETLTIINAESLAGDQRITPGGGIKCVKVEEVKDASGVVTAYRCYFISEQDGEKTETKIIVGDQAISQMFNAKTGTTNKVSNHRYWRLVTGVDNDAYTDDSGNHYGYIELSKSDCEAGSDIPQAEDNIVQFGNRTDRTRQAAMVFSTVDSDAPSIKLFTGIGSGTTNAEHYSLSNKDIISYGYDHVKGNAYFNCYGDTYIGSPDGSTFVKYNRSTNSLDVKATLSIHSTIGNKPIGDYVNGAAQDAANAAKTELEKDIKALQNQVDGVIEAFNGFGAPTLTNYPANEWTTDAERKRHDRDIYTDITPYVDDATTPTSGQSWKWYYNSPTDYGWRKMADSDAVKALQLAQISVRDTDVLYISHTSRTSAPALPTVNASGVITSLNGWSTQSPEWQADKYIWQTTYVRRGDGSATFSDPTCVSGKDGKGIVSVKEFYAVNNDATNAPADAAFVQSPMPQTSPTNRYLWNYEDTTYSDNSHTRTDKAIIGVHGSNGEDGASITAVTNYYLASAAATGVTVATTGWTADASATAATMTNAKPYLWNYEEITYSKGNPTRTAPHVVGRMGRGVSKIEEEYYLSTSQTQLSGGEWKSEANKPVWVPGKYMWTRTKVTYTDGTSEYTGVVCATGGTGTSVLAQYSADGVNWHPSYAANDIWMRTSSDGGTMWTPGMRIVGANYSPNMLKDKYRAPQSHVSAIEHGVQIVPTDVDTYFSVHTDDGVNLADYIGKDITISLDCEGLAAGQKYVFFIGNKAANAIEVHNGHNVNTIKLAAGSTFSNGYVTFDDSVHPAATSTPVKITRACITSGANPAQQWVPAASEMEGTEGKWRKFQWAKNTSTTSEPTSGWQDTPMTAPSGEYVWMRSGLVVPPATNPAKWDAAVRITGDSGRDGRDVFLLDLSNEVAGIACDASGAVTGSYPTVTAKVHKGTEPASGVSFSLPTKTGISTATITSAGVVTMSGMTADTAEITVQAVVGGVTLQSTISLYKVKPGSDGLSYAVNLLKKSNVVQQTVGYVLGSYEWDEHPAVGTDCTLTICGKVGPKDNYIELYQNKGYHKIGNFGGRTETVKSFKFKVTEVAGRTTLVDFYRNPNDGDFDSGTYIKWAVITLGDAPQTCWTPAKSEMEGARVFSLQPSTDSVSRNAMGVLSATKVSATKYVTTGDGMTTTTEHYLYYRRDSESGTSAWTLGAGVGSPTTTQIDILEDTRSVVFELRDSSGMVLDRERVPVISDAADMKVGGTNLLRNSDFIDGLKYWDNNFAAELNAVTIPERNAAIGWYDNRFSVRVSYKTGTQTWRKLLQPIEKGRIVPGKTYTLSGFVYIPDKSAMGAAANGSTAYRLRASMCYKLKNDTSNHDDSVIDLMQATEGEWSYMRGRWTAPANMNIEEKVEMTFYLVANGEYYVNGWKLEEGNVPTAWSAAPEDTSYLRSALRENTSIEGGLVAATMLNLGITEENGEFRVTAGMNGSTKVRGDRSIAFWAGGDAIDAEKPDDGTPAKIVMRHDGTAYFCDNTVRLDASRMEIGEEGSNKLVVLDKDGLKLIDGNEQRLRVVHQSVGTLASAVDSNAVTLNTTEDIRVRRTRHKEVTTISNSGTTKVVGSFTKNFNIGSSNLPVGATVNITASIYSEFPLINDDMEGFPLLGTNARLQIYERQSGTIIFDKKAPLGYDGDKWKDHWAKISANVTIPKAGEYRGNLILEGDGTEGPTYEMTAVTATAKVEGSVQLGFSNQTVLGNDGLLSKWDETAWLVRSGEVHAKVGTTEFVVLPNGIKAIVGGRTIWLAQ